MRLLVLAVLGGCGGPAKFDKHTIAPPPLGHYEVVVTGRTI